MLDCCTGRTVRYAGGSARIVAAGCVGCQELYRCLLKESNADKAAINSDNTEDKCWLINKIAIAACNMFVV